MTTTVHQFNHKNPSVLKLNSENTRSLSLVTLNSLQSIDKYRIKRNDKKTYKSGAWYIGQLDGTQRIGWGQFNWVNGGCYDGNYVDNKRHGDGKYTWSDGSIYVGNFCNDLRHGFGELTWITGERYTGQFFEDVRHGTGTYTWKNGTSYTGNFRNNKKCGFGILSITNGDTFEGIYKDDQKCGAGIYTRKEDGRQDVGLWKGNALIRLCSVAEGSFLFEHMCDHYINAGGNISPNIKSANRDILKKPSTPPSRSQERGENTTECEFTVPSNFPYKLINEGIRSVSSKRGSLENMSVEFLNAVSAGNFPLVKRITESGLINVNVSDKTGYFALLAASVNCHIKVLNYLLDNGANINQLTDEGLSCLSACHILLYASQNYVDNIAENVSKENLFNSVELDKKSGNVINRNERRMILAIYEEIYRPYSEKTTRVDPEQLQWKRGSSNQNNSDEFARASVDSEERVCRFDPWKLDFYHRSMDRVKEVDEINRTFKDIMLNPHKMSDKNVEYIDLCSLPTRNDDSTSSSDDYSFHADNFLHTTVASIMGYDVTMDSSDDDDKLARSKTKALERVSPANETVVKLINSERRPHLLNTIELLLCRGACPSVSSLPMPVLFFAVKSAEPVAVAELLNCKADTSARLDHLNLCALHIAVALPGNEGTLITELLLKHGADPNARDGYLQNDIELGRTPLHIACSREDDYKQAKSIVLLLLSYGADPNLQCFGNAPLSLAIASGNDQVVDALIQHNADVSLKLSNGFGSVLCCATSFQAERRRTPSKRLELVDKLISNGADMLTPVTLSSKLPPGTVMDYAYHVYYQDRRISCTPYHALSSLERECYNARKEMLEKLACYFRDAVLAKEKELDADPSIKPKRTDNGEKNKRDRARNLRNFNLERVDNCGLGYVTIKRLKRQEWSAGARRPSTTYHYKKRYRYCNECGRSVGVRLAPCPRCKEVFYCSKNCKIKLWNSRHREECAKVTGAKTPGAIDVNDISADTVKAINSNEGKVKNINLYEGYKDVSGEYSARLKQTNRRGDEEEPLGFLPQI